MLEIHHQNLRENFKKEISNPVSFPFEETNNKEAGAAAAMAPPFATATGGGEAMEEANNFSSEVEGKVVGSDEIDNERPLMAGFLLKKGEQRRKWKQRWFVLRATRLSYYKSEKEYETLNLIPLETIHSVSAIEQEKRPFLWGIVTKERTFYLQASSKEEFNEWITQVKIAVRKVMPMPSPPTTTTITSPSPLPPSLLQNNNNMIAEEDEDQPPSQVEGMRFSTNMNTKEQYQTHQQRHLSYSSAMSGTSSINGGGGNNSPQSESDLESAFSSPRSSNVNPNSRVVGFSLPENAPVTPTNTSVVRNSLVQPSPLTLSWNNTSNTNNNNTNSDQLIHEQNLQNDVISESEDDPSPSSPNAPSQTATPTSSPPPIGLPHAEDDPTLIQGFLNKLRIQLGGVRSWKLYWFVLRSGKLYCYKNSDEYEVRRLVSLSDVIDILEIDPVNLKGKKSTSTTTTQEFCFKLVLAKKSWILSVGTLEERDTWLRILESQRLLQQQQQLQPSIV